MNVAAYFQRSLEFEEDGLVDEYFSGFRAKVSDFVFC